MKITKSYLRGLIKEEFTRLEEENSLEAAIASGLENLGIDPNTPVEKAPKVKGNLAEGLSLDQKEKLEKIKRAKSDGTKLGIGAGMALSTALGLLAAFGGFTGPELEGDPNLLSALVYLVPAFIGGGVGRAVGGMTAKK